MPARGVITDRMVAMTRDLRKRNIICTRTKRKTYAGLFVLSSYSERQTTLRCPPTLRIVAMIKEK